MRIWVGASACSLFLISLALAGAPNQLHHSGAKPEPILATTIQAGSVEDATVTKALQAIHARAQNARVLFGIELISDSGPPQRRFRFSWGHSTLREILDKFIEQDQRYTYALAAPNVIHIYPVGATDDPQDLLNVRVKRFKAQSEDPNAVLSGIRFYVPELDREIRKREGQELSRGAGVVGSILRAPNVPKVSLELHDVTVRQILNQVLQQSSAAQDHPNLPKGWVYEFKVDKSVPSGGHSTWRTLP